MWPFAKELRSSVNSVADLHDVEYESCLEKVHAHVKYNKSSLSKKYECGKGARSVEDRGVGDEEQRFGSELEQYNGIDGGRVFKWYTRGVFNKHLSSKGTSERSCTERQCVDALAAASEELRVNGLTAALAPFAGPQCFAHLNAASVECRVHANK